MANAATADPADRVLLGILLTSIAYFLFSAQDAAIKLLVAGISVWQVMVFRSLVVLAGCYASGGAALFRDASRSPVVKPMLLRSVLTLAAWLCYYTAAKYLQLAEMTTIYFAAPVIVTALSVLILREQVPLLRWAAVFLGFAGVFIACDPATLGITFPILLVLGAAFFWALAIVLLRKIALQERTIVQLLLNNMFFLVAAGVPMLFVWRTPSVGEFLLLLTVGVLGGAAQLALFDGMKRAAASVIAPFEYTSLVWAFLFGYLIWHDVPRLEVVAGAVLIVFAGLIVIFGEHFSRRGSSKTVLEKSSKKFS
ncbi:DMT family transporter [Mesorhizobium sp. LHD-90]|uniref:DMT family transporter n=1 Tax=Mesorhizobium sp. LHD-90 TaxID=3071414 RepID=UPI0027E0BCDF|nr:DMT family transporter [Mesorhizobium sp. LHD-90]MDQ6435126.1 DMT family transporter [Mesorhizobium sp. LHD-90]